MVKRTRIRDLPVTLVVLASLQAFVQAGGARPNGLSCFAERGQATAPSLVAEATQWFEAGRLGIRVYHGKEPVHLARFTALLVITPLGSPPQRIENLVGSSIAIVRSQKRPDRWEIYRDVWIGRGREDTVADNVFTVKQVLISSGRHPVGLKVREQIVYLKTGEALLVL